MYSLKSIQHSNITKENLDEIIRIKSTAWNYSYDKQKQWIDDNISLSDFHLILRKGDENVGYMNLINIEFLMNGITCRGYGIGNVCSVRKGFGYGKELMDMTNCFIVSNNKIGVLLCKNQLVKFYEKNGWRLLSRDKITFDLDNSHIETMVFNIDCAIDEFIYCGKIF